VSGTSETFANRTHQAFSKAALGQTAGLIYEALPVAVAARVACVTESPVGDGGWDARCERKEDDSLSTINIIHIQGMCSHGSCACAHVHVLRQPINVIGLNRDEIRKRCGRSKPTVRRALQRLAGQGLLAYDPRYQTFFRIERDLDAVANALGAGDVDERRDARQRRERLHYIERLVARGALKVSADGRTMAVHRRTGEVLSEVRDERPPIPDTPESADPGRFP
jgi:hypothetical protein